MSNIHNHDIKYTTLNNKMVLSQNSYEHDKF